MNPPEARAKGTFLLGVGAQKAGTAWLHRYLQESPACDPGFQKEYHVWDVLDAKSGAHLRTKVLRGARRALAAVEGGGPVRPDPLRLALFYADPTTYFDYFAALLDRSDQVRLTADITPSYAMLDAARFAHVRDGMARRGVRTVALLSMRDPVERCFSAARMNQDRHPEEHPGSIFEVLEAGYALPSTEGRTRYDLTLARLEEVFAPEDLVVLLYERMFDQDVLDDVCARVGIDAHAADLDRRVNATAPREQSEVPRDLARRIAQHYAPVYADLARRRPELDLEAVWPSARLL